MLRTGTNEFLIAVMLIAISGIVFYQVILNGM
jgi:TRAP-type C4-dicarboxylate transport system permease small subunit